MIGEIFQQKICKMEENKTFSIGFKTRDFSCSTRDDYVSITAIIEKEEFDNMIYAHGVYIAEFLKEKGIIL